MMQKYFVVCLCIFLIGCTKYAKGPAFEPAADRADYSILYVYHAKSWGVFPINVRINGKSFVKLLPMGYTYIYVKPGVYRLIFGGVEGNFITEVEVKESTPAFVKYASTGYGTFSQDVPLNQALEELKDYKYTPSLPQLNQNRDSLR